MKKLLQLSFIAIFTGLLNSPGFTQKTGSEYPDPARFEEAIRKFESSDSLKFPPQNAIVCIGSSSMRAWHSTIHEDLAPLTVIPRGFGGSNMNDALYYADRIVIAYKPRAVVVYEGDNDIAAGISPKMIKKKFQKFVKKIHHKLPECRIYFISIKPSIRRWSMWPEMQEANHLISEVCKKDKRLTFMDVSPGMLDDTGKPRKEIFKEDMLHMNRDGYLIWKDTIRPVLIEDELQYEPKAVKK